MQDGFVSSTIRPTIAGMNPRLEYLADCSEALETLASWHHAQWGHMNPQRTLADRVAKFQTHLQRESIPTTIVAWDQQTLLGSASLVECDLQRRSDLSPWLASVYVAPECRGHGVGNAVVERIEDEARSLGVATLYLFTTDREAFYTRRGWQTFATDQLGEHRIVLMSLELDVSVA